MAKTSISSLFLLLLCFQISILPFATASQDPQDSDPFYTPETVVSHSRDLEIIPGITKHLLIKLQGQEEEVTFSFQPDEADPSVFESLVLVNNKVEVSHVSNFHTQESLSVSFNYDAGQCTISGDKGFMITGPIHEKEYKVEVIHDKGAGYQEEIVTANISDTIEETNRTFVIGAAAGTCGLLVIGLKVGIAFKKRRKSVILGDLPARCFTDEELSKKDAECEGEENYKGYVQSLTELPLKTNPNPEPALVKVPPKVSPKSLLSTASTLGVIAPPSLFKKGKAATHVKFTDEDIQESNETERKACVQKACTMAKLKPEIKKQPFKEDNNNETVELSLDLDCDADRDPRRAPTVKEIRALVKKMEAEGTINYDCDPSAESDDEDQYEAPVLPNYFCCMLCFQGKRCTMVKPCRHIFSCTDCVEDLLKSYKICVLCANEINGYEPL